MIFTSEITACAALKIIGISILNWTGFKASPFNTAYIPPLDAGEKKSALVMNL
jgi:hypothetical protein